MKIAVTGANGFVGRAMVRHLCEKGHEVVAVVRDQETVPVKFPEGTMRRVSDFSRADLRNCFSGVEAVIHLAGKRLIPAAEGFRPFWEANVRLTEIVILAAREAGVPRFSQASSLSVYSVKNQMPCKECDVPIPAGFYGLSKLTCEYIASTYARSYPIRINALRLAGILGCGDATAEKEGFMLSKFVQQARARQTITIWGKGEQARDTIYIKDAVNALEKAIQLYAPQGVFNIGAGRAISVREMAETANAVFANDGNLIFDLSKPEDNCSFYMDSSRAVELLGWRQEWSLKEALEDMRKVYE